MLDSITTGRALIIFLLFAGVGLVEMAFVVYRIYRSSRDRDRLRRLREHLEQAHEADRVEESFYREQIALHEGETKPKQKPK